MKQIHGKISIGAPRSLKRYESANFICADCLEVKPETVEYMVLAINGTPTCIFGTCYVCEREQTIVPIYLTAGVAA